MLRRRKKAEPVSQRDNAAAEGTVTDVDNVDSQPSDSLSDEAQTEALSGETAADETAVADEAPLDDEAAAEATPADEAQPGDGVAADEAQAGDDATAEEAAPVTDEAPEPEDEEPEELAAEETTEPVTDESETADESDAVDQSDTADESYAVDQSDAADEPPVDESAPTDTDDTATDEPAEATSTNEDDQPKDAVTTANPILSRVSSTVAGVVPLVRRLAKTRPVGIAATALVGVVGMALLVAGCGALGTNFFQNHAKPGTAVFGMDVTGFSPNQVRNVTATIMDNYQVTLELGNRQVKATPKELGISFNLNQTVNNAMVAGNTAEWAQKYSPFVAKEVPLVMSVNEEQLQTYLDSTFISAEQRSIPANVAYNADQDRYVIVPSVVGSHSDSATVARNLIAGQGYLAPLTVATTDEPPAITDSAAQQVADAANQLLAHPYVLTAGSKSYTIPLDNIGAWTVFTQDVEAGTVNWTLDAAQVTAALPAMLTANLTTAPTSRQILTRPSDGIPLATQRWGSDGTRVADPDGVTAAVVAALQAGAGLNLDVAVTTEPFITENVSMGPEYMVENGARWVEVNRSTFTMNRWEGTTLLSSWTINTGAPATPTFAGVFHVYYMLPIQTMRGPDYVQPDVKWIAYFNGDIALHGNYWVSRFGWASSHGCVGIPESLAKINYDWIQIGDLVVVHD